MLKPPRPLPFLMGVVVGLVALSILGAIASPGSLVSSFVRFRLGTDAASGFFPTPRLLERIVRAQSDPEQVVVIVGGSSVLNGVGQRAEELWTKRLQEELGPRFAVLNFAMTGGRSSDFGIIPAESLLLQKRKVIYVADSNISFFTTLYFDSFYARTIYQAWLRGYLLPWVPRRDYLSQAWISEPTMKVPALSALFDWALNFNDLWNTIQYEYARLIWDDTVSGSLKPRRVFTESVSSPAELHARFHRSDLSHEIVVARSQIYADRAWGLEILSGQVEVTMPRELRAATVAAVRLENPYLRKLLAPSEQSTILSQADAVVKRLQEIGFGRALIVDADFTDDDFVDRLHMVPAGGNKLATVLAPEIVSLSRQLGYLP